MSEIDYIIQGVDIRKASFKEIREVHGIGVARFRELMLKVGRWEEYQQSKADYEHMGQTISQADYKRFLNLVSFMRRFDGYDIDFTSDVPYQEMSKELSARFNQDVKDGVITHEQILDEIVKVRRESKSRVQKETNKRIQKETGVSPDDMEQVSFRINQKFEELWEDYEAHTAADRSQLMAVASMMVNRENMLETQTRLNMIQDPSKSDVSTADSISQRIGKLNSDIDRILKSFEKADGKETDPQKYISGIIGKGKEILDVFAQDFDCPKCGVRHGKILAFDPDLDIPPFSFRCTRINADGKPCDGTISVDIMNRLRKNKVVGFTSSQFFDLESKVKKARYGG